jgi:hypothetical protein|tara:strand:+ start:455 stop:628 length:174 start_codon:yes stop_codon:yes gene_type:complete
MFDDTKEKYLIIKLVVTKNADMDDVLLDMQCGIDHPLIVDMEIVGTSDKIIYDIDEE